MATVKPFRATRYNSSKFPLPPVAPPYDVISQAERERIAQDEYNIVHIDKPGGTDEARYERAAELLGKWQESDVLVLDDAPAFYVYEQEYVREDVNQGKPTIRRGVYVALKLEPFESGVVLPHEKTLAAPKVDRMNLISKTNMNTSPIFGLYDGSGTDVDEVLKAGRSNETLYDEFTDIDGTIHRLWALTNPAEQRKIESALREKTIMIADGHHRYETSLAYSKQSNAAGADHILICLVDFNDSGLVVLPTHRLLKTDVSLDALKSKLEPIFDLTKLTKEELDAWSVKDDASTYLFGLYTSSGEALGLKVKDRSSLEALLPKEQSAEWKQLNVTALNFVIFKQLLNLTDEAFQAQVSYTHSAGEAFDAVDAGEASVAFLMQPIDKFKVQKISGAKELMPQKSTYFFPKLYTGFVMYGLKD